MRLTAKNMTHTLYAAKQGNAEEQPDAGCGIKLWKAATKVAAFLFTGYPIAEKPLEFEGRALISRQAVNLSSKKIANCAYASPQSLTGIVHFFEISSALI